jgi:hypothetical protein
VNPGAERPVVAVLSSVPLLVEGLTEALEGIAEIHVFPALNGDPNGLLHSVKPDAVVVDSEAQAEAAAPFVRETNATLVHILLGSGRLRVLRSDVWDEDAADSPSPEAIRNIVARAHYGRRR